MSNITKKGDSLDVMTAKRIVSVAIIIAITGMFIFSNAFVNPLLAKSSKHEDKTTTTTSSTSTDKKGNSTTTAATTIPTATTTSSASSGSEQSDYKKFQKCLSTTADKQGFDTKTEIQDCFKSTYLPTTSTSSSAGTSSSSSLTNTT